MRADVVSGVAPTRRTELTRRCRGAKQRSERFELHLHPLARRRILHPLCQLLHCVATRDITTGEKLLQLIAAGNARAPDKLGVVLPQMCCEPTEEPSLSPFAIVAYDYSGNLLMKSDTFRDARYSDLGRPAAADIDGDGFTEVVKGSAFKQLIIVQHDGQTQCFPSECYFRYGHVSLADLSRSGKMNIISTGYDELCVFNYLGQEIWYKPADSFSAEPIICNIDSDEQLEIVTPGLFAFNHDGSALPVVWPYAPGYDNYTLTPLVGDINGDARMEIIHQCYGKKAINAISDNGEALPWWPINLEPEGYVGSTAVGDIDKDGRTELVVLQYSRFPIPLIREVNRSCQISLYK